MAIYSADREELNEQIRYYQDVITAYNTRTANATKIAGHASTIVAESTSTNPLFKIIDQSRTNQMIEEIKTFWEDLVQADRNAQNGLDDVQKGIHSINERVHSFTDLLGNNGSNLPNLKPTQLYETMWLDETLIANIMDKLDAGIVLTFSEQDLLYHYFQNEFLTSADIEEIETTASYINETDIDQLKDRLNEEVIISDEALLKEIEMIQAYLYLGNKRPGETPVDLTMRDKLSGYLLLLENFSSKMSDDVFIIVDNLKFEEVGEKEKAFFFQSALETLSYDNRGGLSKEEFQKRFLESRPTDRKDLSIIESMYYPGTNAASTYLYIEKNNLEDKLAKYTSNLLLKEASQKLISFLGKGNTFGIIATATGHLNKIGNSHETYQELYDEIVIKELLITWIDLKMSFNVSNSYYTERPDEELHVKLYPTNSTYLILDRWKLVSMLSSEITYPDELVKRQNWHELEHELQNLLSTYLNNLPELKNYILDGALTNITLTELIEKLEK